MATLNIILRKKTNKQGEYPVAIRITENRKSSYMLTGIYIEEKYWDKENNRVKKSHPNHKKINNLFIQKLAEANAKYLDLEVQGKAISAGQIKSTIRNPKDKTSFYEFSLNYLKQLEDSNRLTQLSSDKPRVKHFNNFIGNKDITFSEIDESLLKRFDVYLKKELSLSNTSIRNNHLVLRSIYNQAIKGGVVEHKYYPYGEDKYKIIKPSTVKIGLSETEVLKLESVQLEPGSHRNHSRNAFLISFYFAGIRVSDVVRLKWSDINDGRLIYSMGKNSKIDSLAIPEKAQKIFDEYISDKRSNDDYIFPELKNADLKDPKDIYRKIKNANKKFNTNLKAIAKELKITKPLSMHIARHTFGNIAGDKVIPQMLQKMYRHSALSTTVGYQGNFIHKDADDALGAVLDF
jgi:integrase/recombinase XerD